MDTPATKFSCRDLKVSFGETDALRGISLDIPDQRVTALIGPSGAGKSTLLRSLNRLNEIRHNCRTDGQVLMDGEDIYARDRDPIVLRARVGMVFQKPNPFPKSIFDNIAYGPRLHGLTRHRSELEERVENVLKRTALWEEVKDRLKEPATDLSLGQQQRLIIARALAVEPEVLLLDEPASALDPVATARLEGLIEELKQSYCIIIVTHSMTQAARISDYTAFFRAGQLIECDDTEVIFTNPLRRATQNYITGRMA